MEEQCLKQQLPFPYNQDLSQVLRRLNRRTPFSRAKLANDAVTAAYVLAGMRLIQRHLGPGAERQQADPEDDSSVMRPLLSFLSQRAVAAELANNPHPFPKVGNVSTLRSTWESHSDFVADLLGFGLWSAQYPGTRQNDARDTSAELLVAGGDAVEAIQELAYWETSTIIGIPSFRLRLLATISAEGDQVISDAMVESYEGGQAPWKQLYAEFLRARGLHVRAGITIDEYADIMSACSAGIALRILGDPTANVIDHARRRSLLGTAAIAILYACVEVPENSTGVTLEQAVRMLLGDD
jgi:hypothetical protein